MANTRQSEPTAPTEVEKVRAHIGKYFIDQAAKNSASRRPLPVQTGDGTYLAKDDPTFLQNVIGDLKGFSSFNVTDVKTLLQVLAKTKTGALWDDSKYLMEDLIQVRLRTDT
jgi:hypothetical protein